MKTYHLHIEGIVQGVGFRPYVYKLANNNELKGTVSNTTDGVHVKFNMDPQKVDSWVKNLIQQVPNKAVITRYTCYEEPYREFDEFAIVESELSDSRSVLLTPDFAICDACIEDIRNPSNRRYLYPFTTCTLCGPRYAIIKALPYDRSSTSMAKYAMCNQCREEYDDVINRRYYSQTNSCEQCGVAIQLKKGDQNGVSDVIKEAYQGVIKAWKIGEIVAIKGIGGYLLTCDATNKKAIQKLRKRKNRPVKPFAVMYHDFYLMAEDVDVDAKAMIELQSPVAPIVLLPKKNDPWTGIAMDDAAPDMGKLGVMLPYSPLFRILLDLFQKPIIATSGNLSGDPICFTGQQALDSLQHIADHFLHHDMDLCIPQDDSVINISPVKRQKIIVRRSRGMAPAMLGFSVPDKNKCVLAMGGLLKSTFGLITHGNIYISQYLGDTDSYQTQQNYKHVLNHMLNVFDSIPQAIVCDKHPSFFSSLEGERLSKESGIPLIQLQHHEAHFYAIMGEHQLMDNDEPVLGVIWDGVGLGHDGEIWGGEFMLYTGRKIKRIAHLPYFPYLLGDKMSKEPRLSALSLLSTFGEDTSMIKSMFSEQEWNLYQKMLKSDKLVKCSSMGRVFDAMACILLEEGYQTFEGEAAMKLENLANQYLSDHLPDIRMSYLNEMDHNPLQKIVKSALFDKKEGVPATVIAAKFHVSLVHYIDIIVSNLQTNKIAFSGGVFQNAWLHDCLQILLARKYKLFFHHKLSPNDENISFGQLMYYIHGYNPHNKGE